MKMLKTTRRKFFALVGGIFAIPFVGKITDTKPLTFKGQEIVFDKQWSVQKFLTAKYNEYAKATGTTPKTIIVPAWMRDEFESQIQTLQRFVDISEISCGPKVMAFKSCRLIGSNELQGHNIVMGGNDIYEAFIQRERRRAGI